MQDTDITSGQPLDAMQGEVSHVRKLFVTLVTLAAGAACVPFAATRIAAQCTVSAQRVPVAALSAAYIASALAGARLSIRDSLPEAPLGIRTGLSPGADFALGFGTSLSPGIPMLSLQAATTAALTGSAQTTRRATHALAVFGAAYAAGQLIEPETYRTLRRPREHPGRTIVVISNILVPATLAVVASRGCR
jgi:hypothetical protein